MAKKKLRLCRSCFVAKEKGDSSNCRLPTFGGTMEEKLTNESINRFKSQLLQQKGELNSNIEALEVILL